MKDRYALFAGLFAAVFFAIFAGSCVSQVPVIANATYTFSPRLQATQGGVDQDVYLDRIIIRDGYFNVVLVDTPVGKGNYNRTSNNWGNVQRPNPEDPRWTLSSTALWDLDKPSQTTWHAIRIGEDNDTGGMFLTFSKATFKRIAITNDNLYPPIVFEEIILSVPD
jgi:hypothetical protein